MTRPEHVRCENCCFWWRYEHADPDVVCNTGSCERFPRHEEKDIDEACGEFRETWPGDSDDEEPEVSFEGGARFDCGCWVLPSGMRIVRCGCQKHDKELCGS